MSCLLKMRKFLQYVAERNYDARYIYRLEDKSYNWRQHVGVSDWKQKEQADVVERDHLQRFFLVARVLFIYFTMKLKMFLGLLQ